MPGPLPPRPLPPQFYRRSALAVARDLLGKPLCCGDQCHRITEVEVYEGTRDLASHAARGTTPRNEVMFGPPGHWYVYLCYGVHWLANIVTGPRHYPAAVLLRGVGPWTGPGKLTRGLGMGPTLDRAPVAPHSGCYVGAAPVLPLDRIRRTPRIGIDAAGPEWAAAPLRLVWKDPC